MTSFPFYNLAGLKAKNPVFSGYDCKMKSCKPLIDMGYLAPPTASKTVGRGFKSCCPCHFSQKNQRFARAAVSLPVDRFTRFAGILQFVPDLSRFSPRTPNLEEG